MSSAGKPRIIACANLAWNLVNFRSGLLQTLVGAGYEIVAVAPSDPELQDRLEAIGCRFIAAPFDAMGISPLRDFKTFLALRRIVRDERPSVWLSWTIKPNIYGTLVAGLHGVPAVPNVSGLGTAFIRRNLLTLMVKLLYRVAFSLARAVFFQNADDRDLFVDSGLARADRTRLVPGSGVDIRHFSPVPSPAQAHRRFLMVARLLGDKGVREYVAAIREVRDEYSDAQFRLMGSLDVANRTAIGRDELESWIGEGLVDYLPPREDVREAMAESDWIVLPSYREGLSRVLLEAGAMARPAITTQVPGCRDVVEDGVNGLLAAPRDAASLAQAMRRAMAMSHGEWQALADAARLKVVRDFSQERVDALYLEEIRSILRASPPAG